MLGGCRREVLAFVEIDLAMANVSARTTVLPRRESGIEEQEGNGQRQRHPYCRAIDAQS